MRCADAVSAGVVGGGRDGSERLGIRQAQLRLGAGRARSEHGWRETEGEQQQEPGGHRATVAEPGPRHPALTPESADLIVCQKPDVAFQQGCCMNFGFTEEQELLRKTARDFLGEHAPIQQVRAILEGPQRFSQPLWQRMAELGWLGLAFPERFGGAGLSMVELGIVLGGDRSDPGSRALPAHAARGLLDPRGRRRGTAAGVVAAHLQRPSPRDTGHHRGARDRGARGLRVHRDPGGLRVGAARSQAVRSRRRRRGSADRGRARRAGSGVVLRAALGRRRLDRRASLDGRTAPAAPGRARGNPASGGVAARREHGSLAEARSACSTADA